MRSFVRFCCSAAIVCMLAAGCDRQSPPQAIQTESLRPSPQLTEAKFIVESVVGHLLNLSTLAGTNQVTGAGPLSVSAMERKGSPIDEPVYDLEIQTSAKGGNLKPVPSLNKPIWSPEAYKDIADLLISAFGCNHSNTPSDGQDTLLLSSLSQWTGRAIEEENQRISKLLARTPADPRLHEQAACVLGAFALREHSGKFCDTRPALCRMTAHLAFAYGLRSSKAPSLEGRVAEAMLFLLMNNETDALTRIASLPDTKEVSPWVRTLKALATFDFRELAGLKEWTPMEKAALFTARVYSVGSRTAWEELKEDEVTSFPDFVRIANESSYSVQIGHVLSRLSLPLEFREAAEVYKISSGQPLVEKEAIRRLNDSASAWVKDPNQFRVIEWGLWAGMFQRQVCHDIAEGFRFMNNLWGVPEEAAKFAKACDQQFGSLRLYPFVRRFNCTTEADYKKAIDDSLAIVSEKPELVTPICWNYLLYKMPFAELYEPKGTANINRWFKHNPPPGTAYSPWARIAQRNFADREDVIARLEALHAMAPADTAINLELIKRKFGKQPTAEQIKEVYGPLLDYTAGPLARVARAARINPEMYEKYMAHAAELDASYYFELGIYFSRRGEEQKAATYYEDAIAKCSDEVLVANNANWLVQYYFRTGQIDKAEKLATRAGEAYSAAGLEALSNLLFAQGKYRESFETILKLEERYDRPGRVIGWCQDYKNKTGEMTYEPEVTKRLSTLFPRGMQKVTLKDFKGRPEYGIIFSAQSASLTAAGIRIGDVVVALNGIRIFDTSQYEYVRDLSKDPAMDFIVWNGTEYMERHTSLQKHRFGVPMESYVHQKKSGNEESE